MYKINIDINQVLNETLKELNNRAEDIVEKMAKDAQMHAKKSTKYKGNKLRNNIIIENTGKYSREVIANTDYAHYVEYGNNSGGAYIYPKRAKALRFEIDGKVIFAKKVRSYKGRYFMKSAKEFVENKAKNNLY